MHKKLYGLVRTTVTSTTTKDIVHEKEVQNEINQKMVQAKKKWIMEY